jgi:hypothetical protein
MAIAAIAARPARGCLMDSFLIVGGLDLNQKATASMKVTFRIGFQDSSVPYAYEGPGSKGSIKIDYGDGTAEDTGPRTVGHDGTWGLAGANIRVDHVYTKPGTFSASLKAGSVENQPCLFSGYFGLGFVVDGKPGIRVAVVPSLPLAAVATQKRVVAVFPTSTPAAKVVGVQQTVGKQKANLAFAFAPGQISRATVSLSVLGNVLKVEGTGRCGLKVFEELDGKALRTYDFKGPLPTTITMPNRLPGIHVAKIEGDKSSESCGGTASASFPIAKKKGVL